jgi:hypothetical protein
MDIFFKETGGSESKSFGILLEDLNHRTQYNTDSYPAQPTIRLQTGFLFWKISILILQISFLTQKTSRNK